MTTNTTILIVEDDVHLLSGIQEILELEKYTVLTAQNGQEGLDQLLLNPDEPPDVIVSDIAMPQMDGFTFLEHVRQKDEWVHVPFIFLTARTEKENVWKGSELGADVYLKKPFNAKDLLVAVHSKLKQSRRRKKVTEQETEQKISDTKRRILVTLNHELRTPLTLVVAYADLLKDFDPSNMDDGEVLTFLRGVNSGATRLRRLIENFILLVEIDSGDAAKTYSWRKYPIESLRDIVMDARQQVLGADLDRCTLYMEDKLPPITADREFLTAVIRELLDNAVKFSAEDAPVEMNLRTVDDNLEIMFRNQPVEGRCIPFEEQEKIWEPFYQINRELYEDQGAGSGLAIVDGVVSIHGGTRTVVSSPDDGTIFTITLPIQDSQNGQG